jgi:hypothetical protein
MGRIRAGVLAVATVVSFGVAGCSNSQHINPTGPSSSGNIVVENTVLEQKTTGGSAPVDVACDVLGKVRNDGSRAMNVEVKFNAFGNSGGPIATGRTGQFTVLAGGRSNFRAPLVFVFDCDDVKRLEIAEITAEPA